MEEEEEGNPLNTDLLLEHLTQVEGVAEDILTDKQKLIDLDRHRNQTREAVRILQKDKSNQKQWLCLGNTFIKMEKRAASRLLEKDFEQTDKEIAKTRTELKPKMSLLRDLEHKDDIKGFYLQSLNKQEVAAIESLL